MGFLWHRCGIQDYLRVCGYRVKLWPTQCTVLMSMQPRKATSVSRSLWLVDPRAADIQAIEGMKSSIF